MVVNPEQLDPREQRRRQAYKNAEALMASFLARWFTGQRARVITRLLALERITLSSVRDLLPASENVSLRVTFEHILTNAGTHTAETEIAAIRPRVMVVTRPTVVSPVVTAASPAPTAAPPTVSLGSPSPTVPPARPAPFVARPAERFIDVAPGPSARRQPVTRHLIHGQRPNVRELVQARVGQSARRVVQINAVTRRAIREQLRIGLERQYSRLQIAAGVPEDGYPGIGSVVEETYHNRPLTIARTEISTITNRAVAEAAGLMGYSRVRVFDGPECGWLTHNDPIKANGMLVHVRSAYAHPIAHPNCRRRFTPEETADVLGSRADGTRVQ